MNVRLLALVTIVASLVACRAAHRVAAEAKAARDERARSLIAQQDTFRLEVEQLSNADLLQRLAEDSQRGASTLDSPVFVELKKRGSSASPGLADAMRTNANALGLVALQALDPVAYRSVPVDVRVRIFVAALASNRHTIDFGVPPNRWGPMATALVETGESALAPLRDLLKDKRRVVVSGSETADEALRFGYRVCDYAWTLRLAIRGLKMEIPVSSDERDKLMAKD